MRPQILKIDNTEYVALPKRLLEEFQDVKAFDERLTEIENEGSDLIPSEVVNRLFIGNESPVKIWREFRGIKAVELAQLSGQGKDYISKLEKNRENVKNAKAGKLCRIAGALSVSLDMLVFD